MTPETSWPAVPAGVLDEVTTIVSSVLSSDELESIVVGWAPENGFRPWDDLHEVANVGETMLLAEVVACGESFLCPLWHPGVPAIGLEPFADQLEDFIAESKFAWGEQRLVPRPWG